MLSKITRGKLLVFIVIGVLGVGAMAMYYVRLPQQVGIGRYGVKVDLAAAGGLYPAAVVTYRGVEVGKVMSVDLQPGGRVQANLQIDNGTKIPRDSIVEVRSSSVIGEQYVDFVPSPSTASSLVLEDGDTVPVDQTVLPITTDALLTAVDQFVKSVPNKQLRTVVHELGLATDGSGDDLARMIDGAHKFVQTASQNLAPTVKLLQDGGFDLKTQSDLSPQIRSFARDLPQLTQRVARADDQVRGVLAAGAPFFTNVGKLATTLRPDTPGVLNDLATVGSVFNIYSAQLEHILTLVPAIIPMVDAAIPYSARHGDKYFANLWFKLTLDPPTCHTGYEYAKQVRSPDDMSQAPVPMNSWCKVAHDDPRAARGARNNPCPNGAGDSATAAGCGLHFGRKERS